MMLCWLNPDITPSAFLLHCQLYPQSLSVIPRLVNSSSPKTVRVASSTADINYHVERLLSNTYFYMTGVR